MSTSTPTTSQTTYEASSSSSMWTAPKFITDFYARLPLVVLDQEDEIEWKKESGEESCILWVS
jgi:hypothetical protein